MIWNAVISLAPIVAMLGMANSRIPVLTGVASVLAGVMAAMALVMVFVNGVRYDWLWLAIYILSYIGWTYLASTWWHRATGLASDRHK